MSLMHWIVVAFIIGVPVAVLVGIGMMIGRWSARRAAAKRQG
jgi:hypothetical protein